MPTARAAREGHRAEQEDNEYDKGFQDERYDDEDQYDEDQYDEAYDEDDERADEGQVTTAGAAAKAAVQQITQLTSKQPESVIAVEPGEGGWRVSVEVIEDQRIPSSADILATYEAAIANTGDLTSYRRISRYSRGHGDGGV